VNNDDDEDDEDDDDNDDKGRVHDRPVKGVVMAVVLLLVVVVVQGLWVVVLVVLIPVQGTPYGIHNDDASGKTTTTNKRRNDSNSVRACFRVRAIGSSSGRNPFFVPILHPSKRYRKTNQVGSTNQQQQQKTNQRLVVQVFFVYLSTHTHSVYKVLVV
jgi:hypothetical protein